MSCLKVWFASKSFIFTMFRNFFKIQSPILCCSSYLKYFANKPMDSYILLWNKRCVIWNIVLDRKRLVIYPKFLKDVVFNLHNTTCCSSSKPSILYTFTFKSHLKTNIHIHGLSQRIKYCLHISKSQYALLHHSFDKAQEFIYFHEYLLIALYLHSLK